MLPLLWLLMQAASPAPDKDDPPEPPPPEPIAALRGVVVDAIRDCLPKPGSNEIKVCSRDRGFAEGEGQRVKKLTKPVAPASSAIKVTVTAGPGAPERRE